MSKTLVNTRAQGVLKLLVEEYIRQGQPIGSKAIAEKSDVGMSSATIRNVMANLEELGLLTSPHTSAGRVPTSLGLRLFVDSLLTTKPLDEEAIKIAKSQINQGVSSTELIQSTSAWLSSITQHTGLVMVPKINNPILRHVEFVPLAEQRVLAIFVFNDRDVQNQILRTEREFTDSELQQAANYLNRHFAGKPLTNVREHLFEALQQDKSQLDDLLQQTIDLAGQVIEKQQYEQTLVVDGEANLLGMADSSGIDCLRNLFAEFSQKRDILHLLDRCISADGVKIFIGDEAGYDVFDACSVVTAPYKVEGQAVGVLGVIGPTRMNYERVIPIVDVTAKLLSTALKDSG